MRQVRHFCREPGSRAARAVAAVGLLWAGLVASAPPASAHWQYTRWGMTPAQVKLASDGAATDNANRSLDAADAKAELTAPYQGSSLPFTAVFMFDDKDQLQNVTLNPVPPDRCRMIRQVLDTTYGKPVSEVQTDLDTTVRWQDLDNNNVVVFLDLGGHDCSVQYSRLMPTHNDGRL